MTLSLKASIWGVMARVLACGASFLTISSKAVTGLSACVENLLRGSFLNSAFCCSFALSFFFEVSGDGGNFLFEVSIAFFEFGEAVQYELELFAYSILDLLGRLFSWSAWPTEGVVSCMDMAFN